VRRHSPLHRRELVASPLKEIQGSVVAGQRHDHFGMMTSSRQLFGLGQQVAAHSDALPHRIGERDDLTPAIELPPRRAHLTDIDASCRLPVRCAAGRSRARSPTYPPTHRVGDDENLAGCVQRIQSWKCQARRRPQSGHNQLLPARRLDRLPEPDVLPRVDLAMNYQDRIVRDPQIVGGESVFKGTRVTLKTVLASLAEDATAAEILADSPTLSEEEVRAAIAFAAASAQKDLPLAETPVKR
jgi:uncharacterized protein (DUF433 family)